jgi:hypothetical protein
VAASRQGPSSPRPSPPVEEREETAAAVHGYKGRFFMVSMHARKRSEALSTNRRRNMPLLQSSMKSRGRWGYRHGAPMELLKMVVVSMHVHSDTRLSMNPSPRPSPRRTGRGRRLARDGVKERNFLLGKSHPSEWEEESTVKFLLLQHTSLRPPDAYQQRRTRRWARVRANIPKV